MPAPPVAASSAPAWPPQLRLREIAAEGATAHGLIAPSAAVASRAVQRARVASGRGGLMARLCGDCIVLWSVEPPDLPWLPETIAYLGAPEHRVFTPIGARVAAPPVLARSWLAALEREHGVAPPILLAPGPLLGRPGEGLAALDLRESVPFEAVDWRRLVPETTGP